MLPCQASACAAIRHAGMVFLQDGPDQLSFNPSDFPALSGGNPGGPGANPRGDPRGEPTRGPSQHLQNLPNGNATSAAPGGNQGGPNAFGVGADLYASMQIHKGQEPFSMQQEEFPALPGSAAPNRGGAGGTGGDHPQPSSSQVNFIAVLCHTSGMPGACIPTHAAGRALTGGHHKPTPNAGTNSLPQHQLVPALYSRILIHKQSHAVLLLAAPACMPTR